MVNQEIVIQNETGLHARPAAQFVQLASKYKSDVFVIKLEKGERINAKSIMAIMAGGITRGTRIAVEVSGEDESEALSALVELIRSNFGEE